VFIPNRKFAFSCFSSLFLFSCFPKFSSSFIASAISPFPLMRALFFLPEVELVPSPSVIPTFFPLVLCLFFPRLPGILIAIPPCWSAVFRGIHDGVGCRLLSVYYARANKVYRHVIRYRALDAAQRAFARARDRAGCVRILSNIARPKMRRSLQV